MTQPHRCHLMQPQLEQLRALVLDLASVPVTTLVLVLELGLVLELELELVLVSVLGIARHGR